MAKTILKLTVRLPEEIKLSIEKIAEESDRTLNEQIVHILRSYLVQAKREQQDNTDKHQESR